MAPLSPAALDELLNACDGLVHERAQIRETLAGTLPMSVAVLDPRWKELPPRSLAEGIWLLLKFDLPASWVLTEFCGNCEPGRQHPRAGRRPAASLSPRVRFRPPATDQRSMSSNTVARLRCETAVSYIAPDMPREPLGVI